MATYSPTPFPRRAKNANLLNELRYQAQLLHYRYEINTGQYVMSPGEKLAFNIINLAIVMLLFSAVYYCMPAFIVHGLRRVAGIISNGIINSSGGQHIEVRKTILHEAMVGDHAASLLPGANTTMGSMPVF